MERMSIKDNNQQNSHDEIFSIQNQSFVSRYARYVDSVYLPEAKRNFNEVFGRGVWNNDDYTEKRVKDESL